TMMPRSPSRRTKPGVTPARSATSVSVSDSFTTGHHRKVHPVLPSRLERPGGPDGTDRPVPHGAIAVPILASGRVRPVRERGHAALDRGASRRGPGPPRAASDRPWVSALRGFGTFTGVDRAVV